MKWLPTRTDAECVDLASRQIRGEDLGLTPSFVRSWAESPVAAVPTPAKPVIAAVPTPTPAPAPVVEAVAPVASAPVAAPAAAAPAPAKAAPAA